MSHVFPRHTQNIPPKAVRAEGCYFYDQSGKAYLDGSGGAAVSCLGHGDNDVIAAIQAQTSELAFAHTGFFTSDPAEKLADLLIAHAPEGIRRVYFTSGGSEAVEAALKLARQYYLEIGQDSRSKIIARRQSYHGNTLGALAAGGNQWRKEPFSPLLIDAAHISPCFEYRGRESGETPVDYGQRLAREFEIEIEKLGPENIMAFVAEPVVGATLGAVPPVEGYFRAIRDICTRHGILLILDEVMCGMGRTGTLFACEQDGIVPDIVTVAKGLGGGYQPIGAMLCSGEIYDAISQGSGFFQHGHTYIGHPVACAGGLAVTSALLDRDMIARSAKQGQKLRTALTEAFAQHPHVGDIRGRGLFQGMEFVADREKKTPVNPKRGINKALKAAAFEQGLICYPMGGTLDGVQGDHVLLAPPFIITDEQIGELVDKLGTSIDQVI